MWYSSFFLFLHLKKYLKNGRIFSLSITIIDCHCRDYYACQSYTGGLSYTLGLRRVGFGFYPQAPYNGYRS